MVSLGLDRRNRGRNLFWNFGGGVDGRDRGLFGRWGGLDSGPRLSPGRVLTRCGCRVVGGPSGVVTDRNRDLRDGLGRQVPRHSLTNGSQSLGLSY